MTLLLTIASVNIINYTIRTVNTKMVIIEILVGPEKLLLFATILPSSASSAAAVSFNEASLLPASIASMASMASMTSTASSLLSSSWRNSDLANRESGIWDNLSNWEQMKSIATSLNIEWILSVVWKSIYRWIFLHCGRGWSGTRGPAPGPHCCSRVWSVLNKVVNINFNLDLHVLSMGERIMDRQSTSLWEFTFRLAGNNPLRLNRKPLISLFLLGTK